ncbi:hypothetical protein [Filimonas effusa]|uniref:Uncharacterized protein n=1 Tax=Filimonas effusa TaxID=2508721 RepID=A0A4Q1D1C4_9BACT|nr:hypothetical protein [Filimonas effusa]RXK80891.1 hypothetical protein ESB13_22310 [Filimonas effusa]
MSYYIRILGTQDPDIHLDQILEALEEEGLVARFGVLEDERPESWTSFELMNEEEEVLALVERNPVVDGNLGQEELAEFKESILEFKPLSAAKWLHSFFDKVKVIYAFELLDAGVEAENYPIVIATQSAIWQKVKGILQADDEGFSNEEGYHILWQFSDDVEGPWQCAVLEKDGSWKNFTMQLGDAASQEAFKRGEVPANTGKSLE